jgi:hypothetical protein
MDSIKDLEISEERLESLKQLTSKRGKNFKEETKEEREKRIKLRLQSLSSVLQNNPSEFDQLLAQCAKTTLEHGFDTSNIPAQLLLIVTEIGEALENVVPRNRTLNEFCREVIDVSNDIEHVRKEEGFSLDFSLAKNNNLIEELCDVQIRLFSFIGGNGYEEEFKKMLKFKMEYNEKRPHMHGKKA